MFDGLHENIHHPSFCEIPVSSQTHLTDRRLSRHPLDLRMSFCGNTLYHQLRDQCKSALQIDHFYQSLYRTAFKPKSFLLMVFITATTQIQNLITKTMPFFEHTQIGRASWREGG